MVNYDKKPIDFFLPPKTRDKSCLSLRENYTLKNIYSFENGNSCN